MKITDFKMTFRDVDTALGAAKMFELRKQSMVSSLDGKFRETRKYQKELAKEAVKNFEVYKQLPIMQFNFITMPAKVFFKFVLNIFKIKFLNMFVRKTPEEKQFKKLTKEYFGKLTKEEIQDKVVDITIPTF